MPSKIRFWKQMRGLLSTLPAAVGLMPTARLGTGTASASTFLRGDQAYATPPNFPHRVIPDASGEFWIAPMCVASTSTLALVANRLYLVPISIGRKVSLTTGAVGSVSGTGNIQCGLYNSDGTNSTPGTLVKDFGSIAAATNTTVATTPVATFDVEPGLYYFAIISNATPVLRAAAAAAILSVIGATSTGGTVNGVSYLFRGSTYGALAADESVQFPWQYSTSVMPMGLMQ